MENDTKRAVRIKVIENGIKKVIEIKPEYVDKNGVAHVSHINAVNARTRDKKADEMEKKEGE